jgi:PKD repeat protein
MKFFLFLLASVFSLQVYAQQLPPVRFSWGYEFFPENFERVCSENALSSADVFCDRYVRYIQFDQTLSNDRRRELAGSGVELAGYIYPATYELVIPVSFNLKTLDQSGAVSVMPVAPGWKLSRSLREPPFGSWAVHGDWIDINIRIYRGMRWNEVLSACTASGMILIEEHAEAGILQARVLIPELQEIAALPFVQYMEQVSEPGEPEDTKGRSLHRANVINSDHAAGISFNGEGVGVLVRDDGQLGPHIDFQGRLFNYSPTPAGQGTHGDGVGGIIGGAGNIDPNQRGMADGTDVYAVDYVNSFLDQTLPLHLEKGVTITNTSYSDGCNAGYTIASQTVDKQIYENPTLMHVFSAGNSNGSDCSYGAGAQWGNITGGHKMAKNAIATANLQADGTLETSSSRGPAYDGRLKPDIAANGTDQGSTNPDNTYQVFGGTSGAAPGIAGCLAQLTQAYKAKYSEQPPAALLKGVILNTANDLGNTGPDFRFGWGHINAWRAWQLLQGQQFLTDTISSGEQKNHILTVPPGVSQLRVMLVWSDPPASPQAGRALLNDLDIQVTAPDGTVREPWILNPTPVVAALSAPATRGRDTLNPVEQVAADMPVPGTYNIQINGSDVPLGPQAYHIVWSFLTDSVKLTYPNGGEGIVPGTTERIHWDAEGVNGDFELSYSSDSGATFTAVATVPALRRMYDWVVPSGITAGGVIRIARNGMEDRSDYPFNIAPLPQSISIIRVCPDSMTVSCAALNDTLNYDLYMLGGKYMELKATADTNVITVPIANPGDEQWVSMGASTSSGLRGRRAVAVRWPGGLLGCPQNYDLSVKELLSPSGDAIIACGAVESNITVRVGNDGINPVSDAVITYQVNDETPVSELLPLIQPGESLSFSFATPLSLAGNGLISLRIWSSQAADNTNFNDTILTRLPVVTQAVSGPFTETFEGLVEAPLGWVVSNPDDAVTWKLSLNYNNLIGKDGDPTRAWFMNHFNYSDRGQEDYLYMIPIEVTGVDTPSLNFDLAHRAYGNTYSDGLRVELFPGCDLGADPVVLFEKFDPELATAPNQTSLYVTSNAADWKTVRLDLSPYAGQKVVVRFASVNDYGNTTFIDNIGMQKYVPPVLPVAAMLNPPDTACRQTPVTFQAQEISQGASYSWNFGTLVTPANATGPGPHTVTFLTPGQKTVIMTASNADGATRDTQRVTVLALPTPNFTVSASNLVATFTNSSTNATSYLWDFGDGTTSAEVSPVHTYAQPGSYTIKLEANNQCKTNIKTFTLNLTSDVESPELQSGIMIAPNPCSGDFVLTLNSDRSETLRCDITDAQGRVVRERVVEIRPGENSIQFHEPELPAGVYFVLGKKLTVK